MPAPAQSTAPEEPAAGADGEAQSTAPGEPAAEADGEPGHPARAAAEAAAEAATVEDARAAVSAPVPAGAAAVKDRAAADPLIGDLRRAGLLPLLVLHFVGTSPTYGNQLMERIAALTNGALVVNPNTMYPLLRQLEARGLISGEWEHPERRSRRFYRCTPQGAAERDRLAAELGPRLDRIAASIDAIRAELL